MINLNWTNDSERIAVMGYVYREAMQSHKFKVQELEGALEQANARIELLKGYLKSMSEGAHFDLPPELGV